MPSKGVPGATRVCLNDTGAATALTIILAARQLASLALASSTEASAFFTVRWAAPIVDHDSSNAPFEGGGSLFSFGVMRNRFG